MVHGCAWAFTKEFLLCKNNDNMFLRVKACMRLILLNVLMRA